ncbi:hypothetical protein [Thermosulfurimonas sp. F29]|uniref:hypothetical protein n=1 Tax=Thermosulfurimonas sp. F29 TaxID=2867247 RepID=UPI00351D5320
MACALAGYTHPEEVPREFLGALFETLVFMNLWSLKDLVPGAALFFLHTSGGREWEVDFLLKFGPAFQAF